MATKLKKTVLLVEDDKPLIRALTLKLASEGHKVITAGDGEEALARLEGSEKPDLILLDLIMPKMDGFQVLTRLKEKKNNIPVFVLSNLGQTEDEVRAKELGAQGFFIKSNLSLVDIVDLINKS